MAHITVSNRAQSIDEGHQKRQGAPGTHLAFDRLVRTIWRLRQSDGCPWDQKQTHKSLAKHLIEESYEAYEAIQTGSTSDVLEELGDVLEQVVLNAQVAADEESFSIDDVCDVLNEKLIRRHPHVFGEEAGSASTEGEVEDLWERVKQEERAAKEQAGIQQGLLSSVPQSLPALIQCQKISSRAAKVGFEWETTEDVWAQVNAERQEFEAEKPGSKAAAEEFGDILFSLVNVARKEGIDAEEALAASNRKFRLRWERMEELADLESLSTEELNVLWQRVKKEE